MHRTDSERRVIVRKVDYRKHGFSSRKEYLQDLADSYSLSFSMVLSIANDIGAAHDFGLLIQRAKEASLRVTAMELHAQGYDVCAMEANND